MSKNFDSPIEVGFCGAIPEPVDAAESLPAEPERELMPCLNAGCGKELNHDGDCDYEYYGPVAPVEAKEKERCEHGVWLADHCYKCAEPKPTPSTLVAEEKEPDWDKLDYGAKEHGCPCANCAEPVAPVEAKEKEPETTKIPCYEVYDAKDIDCTVFQHERMNDLQEFVYQLLDGLEDGESIRIEFKNYTQEELDEVYDEL